MSPAICHAQNKEDLYGIYKRSCEEFVDVLCVQSSGSGWRWCICTGRNHWYGSWQHGWKPDSRQEKYADVEADIIALKEKATALQADFLRLVEADAEAFEPLAKAYGMPRETEGRES